MSQQKKNVALARERGYYNGQIYEKGARVPLTDEDAKHARAVVKENERIRALPADQQQKEAKEGRIVRTSWLVLEADLTDDEKKEVESAERAAKVAADAAESEAKDGTARKR